MIDLLYLCDRKSAVQHASLSIPQLNQIQLGYSQTEAAFLIRKIADSAERKPYKLLQQNKQKTAFIA